MTRCEIIHSNIRTQTANEEKKNEAANTCQPAIHITSIIEEKHFSVHTVSIQFSMEKSIVLVR